jgi:hypothetical protein
VTTTRGSVRTALAVLDAVLGVTLASACTTSSPADVEARLEFAREEHASAAVEADDELRRAEATYREDLAQAELWDQHVLGIPAAGWVPILIGFLVVLTGIMIWVIWLVSEARADRRRRQQDVDEKRVEAEQVVAVERERTRQKVAERGACTTCGAQPLAGEDRARLEES